MTRTRATRTALGLVGMLALGSAAFSSCYGGVGGGGGGSTTTTTTTVAATLPRLTGETLNGTDTTGTCPPPGDAGSVSFTASGTATGPYPGTFTATGYWELDLLVLSAFHESFTITSGTTTVTGTADYTGSGQVFAACDGRAYNVPKTYSVTITGGGNSRTDTGTSTANIVYGTFGQTFG